MVNTEERLDRFEQRLDGFEQRTSERLGRLEQRVGAIEATLVHMATKADIVHMATKADIESVKTLIAERESTMLRWLMGMVAASGLAVTIALIRTFIG